MVALGALKLQAADPSLAVRLPIAVCRRLWRKRGWRLRGGVTIPTALHRRVVALRVEALSARVRDVLPFARLARAARGRDIVARRPLDNRPSIGRADAAPACVADVAAFARLAVLRARGPSCEVLLECDAILDVL